MLAFQIFSTSLRKSFETALKHDGIFSLLLHTLCYDTRISERDFTGGGNRRQFSDVTITLVLFHVASHA